MSKQSLIVGDVLAITLVTFIGFATHGETDLSFLPRMLALFLPLTLAWLLLAPWLGLFQNETVSSSRGLWLAALTMLFAAPFAAILRGLWLNASIIPIFAVVLCITSSIGMTAWRGLYLLLLRRKLR